MKYYPTQLIFADVEEDGSAEDEIDELFSQLLRIEPPATLVNDILALVARLPLPQMMGVMDGEGLVVRDEVRVPS